MPGPNDLVLSGLQQRERYLLVVLPLVRLLLKTQRRSAWVAGTGFCPYMNRANRLAFRLIRGTLLHFDFQKFSFFSTRQAAACFVSPEEALESGSIWICRFSVFGSGAGMMISSTPSRNVAFACPGSAPSGNGMRR